MVLILHGCGTRLPSASAGGRQMVWPLRPVLLLTAAAVCGAGDGDAVSHYSVLGVGRSATGTEIAKAYRALAKEWHPDKNGSPDAEERFTRIVEAYEVLADAESRKWYDISGTNPRRQPSGGGGGGFDFGGGLGGSPLIFACMLGDLERVRAILANQGRRWGSCTPPRLFWLLAHGQRPPPSREYLHVIASACWSSQGRVHRLGRTRVDGLYGSALGRKQRIL